jgi:hypothetical protein
VYLGVFDQEPAKEVVFRLKLLLQNVHNARLTFENTTAKSLTPQQIEAYQNLWSRMRVEVLITKETDKERIANRVVELTKDLVSIPWKLVTQDDIETTIQGEYAKIGDI